MKSEERLRCGGEAIFRRVLRGLLHVNVEVKAHLRQNMKISREPRT
jgi:hypothetical protein